MPFLEQADLPKVVEQAKKVSKDLVEWINKGYKVVTLTASCGLMLKFEWPLLLPNDDKIKKLSANVMDIDEYVVDIANNEGLVDGLQEIDGGVTVHHACHARAQNMGIKARDMLKLILDKFKHISCFNTCLLYTSPSPRDKRQSRMPSSA